VGRENVGSIARTVVGVERWPVAAVLFVELGLVRRERSGKLVCNKWRTLLEE
jgi:hypothetical protein